MLYKYTAYTPTGRLIEEEIEASSIGEVLLLLQKRGLKPILVKPKYRWFSLLRIKLGAKKKITIEDQIFLTKYLHLMLKVGTNLIKAIEILKEDFPKPAVQDFLEEVKAGLEKGQPFWSAFAKHPKYFSPTFVATIKAGETSGKLEESFKHLSESLEKQATLRKSIKSALVYPTLLVVTSLLVVGIIVFFAMPRISKIFLSTGTEPPTFTKIIISISAFISSFGVYIVVALIVLLILIILFYKETQTGKELLIAILYQVPGLNKILEKIDLQNLCSVLASLLAAGLPLIESIEIAAETIKSPKMKEALIRIAKNRLTIGQTLEQALRSEKESFPQVLINLIGMSEKAGHLEETLNTLAEFYTKEVDATVKGIMSIIEPVLLVFIGLVVALVALSTIVPIYQMVTKIAQ